MNHDVCVEVRIHLSGVSAPFHVGSEEPHPGCQSWSQEPLFAELSF